MLCELPDNNNTGALEDLLLECGDVNYKDLKDLAMKFRDDARAETALVEELRCEYGANGGQKHASKCKKTWVRAMGAVLVPVAVIQN